MVDANLDDEDDGANTESEGGDGEASEEGGGNKKIIIIIAALLLLIGGGAGAYFAGLLDPLLGGGDAAEESHDEEDAGHGEESHDEDAGHGGGDDHGSSGGGDHGGGHGADDGHGGIAGGPVFLQVPDQRVNLNATDGRNAYLQLSIQLELKNQGDKARVEAVMPRVIDQFQTYLRELRVEDLRGSQGVQRLAVELLIRVNQAAAPVEVQDVLFSEILIQEN